MQPFIFIHMYFCSASLNLYIFEMCGQLGIIAYAQIEISLNKKNIIYLNAEHVCLVLEMNRGKKIQLRYYAF